MENFDRIDWTEGLVFNSFGVRIGIRINQPDFLESLERVLPPGRKPTSASNVQRLYSLVVSGSRRKGGVGGFNLLYDGEECLAKDRDLAPVLDLLETQLRRTIAEMAPRCVFVHAGVVEYRGRAIVIPGLSMSGKSTLVSALLGKGATYYSDEYAVLDDKGFVHPFAKPISLRKPGTFESVDYDIENFGATAGVKAIPIGLVVITRYQAGARWRPRTLTQGQGVLALFSHCIAARRRPQRVLATLRGALGRALVLNGIRGQASELAECLLEVVEHEERKEPGSSHGRLVNQQR